MFGLSTNIYTKKLSMSKSFFLKKSIVTSCLLRHLWNLKKMNHHQRVISWLIHRIRTESHNGVSILVHGPSSSGKTSFIQNARSVMIENGIECDHVICENPCHLTFFSTRVTFYESQQRPDHSCMVDGHMVIPIPMQVKEPWTVELSKVRF